MSKQAKLIVRLIPLESFELIRIYLKKCVQKGLKKCDYTIYMDMNDYDYITTLLKRGLKTRSYNMDMNKKDLKRLSKSQLIKLLLKQEAKNPSNSINEHEEIIKPIPPLRSGKWESIKSKPVPRKSINEDIILPPSKQFHARLNWLKIWHFRVDV